MPRLALKSPRYTSEDDLHEQVARALAILLPPPVEWTTVPAGGYELSAARLRAPACSGWGSKPAGRTFSWSMTARSSALN